MTVSPLIVASESSTTTSAAGAYSISLQYSVYAVEVTYYNNRPISAGQITLNSETQTGLDLPTLLNGGQYEPATPAWITQIQQWVSQASASAASSASSATLAKAEADRSKTEADRASQIAGLATVDQAVRAAKLPIPDVSIPFTTDGRMTHGKGAPVLVGTTPVAQLVTYERLGSQTMIDKSGRLVTVPAGEMAIEQQGLAIFDQSTNVGGQSINWPASANAASPWVHGAADGSGWITVSGAGDASKTEGSYKGFPGIGTVDVPYTFSLDVLKTSGLNLRLRAYGSTVSLDVALTDATVTGANAAEAVTDMGSYWRVEVTRTFNGGSRMFRIYPFGTIVGAMGSLTYRRAQVEQKPFATPYIENATSASTTRPATTRCDIPWPGNMQPLTDWQELTIAFEFDIAGVLVDGGSQHIFANGSGGGYFLARFENNGLLRFYRSAGPTHQYPLAFRRRYKMCYRINRNLCDLFVDGVRVSGSITAAPRTPGFTDLLRFGYSSGSGGCLNGHLRNINIWNSPLTDAQCVAASS